MITTANKILFIVVVGVLVLSAFGAGAYYAKNGLSMPKLSVQDSDKVSSPDSSTGKNLYENDLFGYRISLPEGMSVFACDADNNVRPARRTDTMIFVPERAIAERLDGFCKTDHKDNFLMLKVLHENGNSYEKLGDYNQQYYSSDTNISFSKKKGASGEVVFIQKRIGETTRMKMYSAVNIVSNKYIYSLTLMNKDQDLESILESFEIIPVSGAKVASQTYKNTDFGIQLDHPESFGAKINTRGVTPRIEISPLPPYAVDTYLAQDFASVFVSTDKSRVYRINDADLFKKYVRDAEEAVVESAEVTIDGVVWKQIKTTQASGSELKDKFYYYTVKDGVLYKVVYTGASGKFGVELDKIAKSVKLLGR